MGWLFCEPTKEALIRHCLGQGIDNETVKTECIAHSLRGNHLWTVFQETLKVEPHTQRRFIVLFLLSAQRGWKGSNYHWGYKDIEETMGPVEKDCPLKFLDMATEPLNDWSREWREKVREHHKLVTATKKKVNSLRPGDTFTMSSNVTRPTGVMTLVRRSRSGLIARDSHGKLWRVRAKHVE